MVLASGALLKYSDGLNEAERQHCRERATRAIRYAVSSHITGTQKCTDGKSWGGSWQSAMWTATLTFGARLFWDDLDPELQQGVERVVMRPKRIVFLKLTPPAGRIGDTKAEENGWNMTPTDVERRSAAPPRTRRELHRAAKLEQPNVGDLHGVSSIIV